MITKIYREGKLVVVARRVAIVDGRILLDGRDATDELEKMGHWNGSELLNVHLIAPGSEI